MSEILFIISLIGGLILPFLLLTGWGRKFWVATMSIIGAVVCGAELIGMITLNKTISRMYWEWSLAHESTSWIVASLIFFGWMSLILHLQWRVLKRHFDKK